MPIGELMNVTNEPQTVAVDPMAAGETVSVDRPRWPKDYVWATIVLVACFSVPLIASGTGSRQPASCIPTSCWCRL